MEFINDLNTWMINQGRCSGDPVSIASHFCTTLTQAGVPLWRVNIGQRFANPLLIAWGVVWTPEGTQKYDVTHEIMHTSSYTGSSFEYIMTHRKPLHKSLRGLDADTDHISYLEFAEQGGTDYYASLLHFGDGSIHGCTFVSRDADGFRPEHLQMIEAALPALACALEPITMRNSSRSLLRSYLGDGPSEAVWNGTIKRGERSSIEAVIMFTDLRGFTSMSDTATEDSLLQALNSFFDLIVQSVEDNDGDVLKFMGDGILSIFPTSDGRDRALQCRNAAQAASQAMAGLASLNVARASEGERTLEIGVGLNVGEVSYGNIGSPGRLDFTVLGGAVNVASRIEGLTKSLEQPVLAAAPVAQAAPELFTSSGHYTIRGITGEVELFRPVELQTNV